MQRMTRDADLRSIQDELSAFARRTRGRTQTLHPDLSFVAYTLLTHIRATGGCRATDLSRHYGLDKSTVSRQVADLQERGLVRRVVDPADGRIQTLELTDAGQARLQAADETLLGLLRERVAGWPPDDVARFAQLLERFNGD
jgi:DNA-binding MarR family transcriptional regulator